MCVSTLRSIGSDGLITRLLVVSDCTTALTVYANETPPRLLLLLLPLSTLSTNSALLQRQRASSSHHRRSWCSEQAHFQKSYVDCVGS
jgi:hypothetical protein